MLDPLIAHIDTAGCTRQRGRQVHQVGAAYVQHGRNQKTQLLALRLALARQAPTQILDDPLRKMFDPAHRSDPTKKRKAESLNHTKIPQSKRKLMDGKALVIKAACL